MFLKTRFFPMAIAVSITLFSSLLSFGANAAHHGGETEERINNTESKRTVLITGANRGIGLALAANFHAAGYKVIGSARKPAKADALHNLGVQVEQLDVTDQVSVSALAERLKGVEIDILINNAGISGKQSKKMATIDVDDIMRTLNVNTLGPVRVMQALLPNVVLSQQKLIVNVSSMMGSLEMNTWGCCAGYRASKSALNSINQTFSVDFAESGVAFVVMHPGYVQTDMNGGQGNITPDQSAKGLMQVITGLSAKDNGAYLDWEGKVLPW